VLTVAGDARHQRSALSKREALHRLIALCLPFALPAMPHPPVAMSTQ